MFFRVIYSGPLEIKVKRSRIADKRDKNTDQENLTNEKRKTNEEVSNERNEKEGAESDIGDNLEKKNDTEQLDDTNGSKDSKNKSVNSESEKKDMIDNNPSELDTNVDIENKQTKFEEISEDDNKIDKQKNVEDQVRPYKVGDTFTPQELFPVAIKLRAKGGKGFVSSSKSAEQLADKLFEAFFMTFKRIVTLEEPDITGLDALQALALSGEAVQNTSDTVTEPAQTKYLRGQFVKMKNKPKTSKFKLIMKRIDSKENQLQNAKRRGIELAKKLRKKRRLVVNKHRRAPGGKLMMLRKKRRLVINERRQGQQTNTPTDKKDPACHWGYECSDPADLDTCQLFTKCKDHKNAKEDYIAVPHNSDEHSKAIKQFRKMLGISLVDEEVEKILESRIISVKPNRLNADERVESLAEYFNSIIMEQDLRTTTALSPSADNDDTIAINNDSANEEQNKKMIETNLKNESREYDAEAYEIRKSLKFFIKTTPFLI